MPNNRGLNDINITMTTDGSLIASQADGGVYVGQPFSVTETLNNWRSMEAALQQEVPQDRELPIDVMKQRHLDGNERMIFHRPKKDWVVTKNGTEICRSSGVLDVSDLIAQLV